MSGKQPSEQCSDCEAINDTVKALPLGQPPRCYDCRVNIAVGKLKIALANEKKRRSRKGD